jgi:hypothetical protein
MFFDKKTHPNQPLTQQYTFLMDYLMLICMDKLLLRACKTVFYRTFNVFMNLIFIEMRSLPGAAHRTRHGTRRDMRCEIRKKIPICIPSDMAVDIGRGWPQGGRGRW